MSSERGELMSVFLSLLASLPSLLACVLYGETHLLVFLGSPLLKSLMLAALEWRIVGTGFERGAEATR